MTSGHFDVLIVGAGISGISAAVHLKLHSPGKTFAILEGREALGGTWHLFRYPGIRSDSDMHTLGFTFKPWTEAKSIADGPSILKYMNETADEYGLRPHLHLNRLVTKASWSSRDARWTLTVTDRQSGATESWSCNVLYMGSGYYSYKKGYTPEFPGFADFKGKVIHPQFWPEGFDYSGKKVVVIGSGATAMTLVPSMSKDAAHITMLQRSPTYVISRPDRDALANFLRRILPDSWAYRFTRAKNTFFQQWFYRRTRTHGEQVKKKLLDAARKELPDYENFDRDFVPRYMPWDQRLCLIPNADLFEALKAGRASIVTDEIETFTSKGIKLKSGKELDADIIVTATGLKLEILGEVAFDLDGKKVDFAETVTYKNLMFSGVPNLVATQFGYVNASWTLRADLNSAFLSRLVNHMGTTGATQVVPVLPPADQGMEHVPWLKDFPAGYFLRDMHRFPKQGTHEPWLNTQSFWHDKKLLLEDPIDDGVLTFSGATADTASPARRQAAE
ncbi:MAG TPA: NAD(P)/FAD-dependent oxidoreductase [Micropepsaceae bacterium]|nr:NAD(P)/FAD-dependent oxidoreductase [Micropepsaceae bacterium]